MLLSQADALLTSSLLMPLHPKQDESMCSPGSEDDEACVPVCPISPLGKEQATPKSPPYQAAAPVTSSTYLHQSPSALIQHTAVLSSDTILGPEYFYFMFHDVKQICGGFFYLILI